MNVEMIERPYRLPDEVWLRYFGSLTAFAEHVRDHFAQPHEPWHAVFGRDLTRRLAAVPTDDPAHPGLAGLYREVVVRLHEGVLFAQDAPLYVRLGQDRGDGQRPTVYLLAREGYVIIARDGHVRTAFFPGSTPADSAYNRFRAAWDYVRQKASRAGYFDRKGGSTVRQTAARWESEANWDACPNPHPRRIEAPVEVSRD